jgi:hypothetical protein
VTELDPTISMERGEDDAVAYLLITRTVKPEETSLAGEQHGYST